MDSLNKGFKYNDITNRSNNYINNYTNNILQSSYDLRNPPSNNSSNNDIKKMIREEFESLIVPYKKQIYSLKEEINNIYNNLNRDSIENLIKEIRLNLYNFVDKKYFNQKIDEIDSKIDNNAQNLYKPQNKIINNIITEIKKMKLEINNIKMNNNSLNSNLSKQNFNLKQNLKEPNEDIKNLNEIKFKDIIDKTSFLKSDFENLKEEMNSFKKSISSSIIVNNKNLSELELNIENLKTDFSSDKLQLLKDSNKTKEDLKKIKYELNEIKISNESISIDNQNKNNNYKIYEILEDLKLTKLSNFDMDKYNIICESYEKLMKNYITILERMKNQNNNIMTLNNKLNEFSFLAKKQAKKEVLYNSEDNPVSQKKIEFLERQIQYLQDRTEKISLDAMHVNEANLDYGKRKEEILMMKQEINKLNNKLVEYYTLYEESNKRNEQINLRIDEIKKELKEEKNINLENKMNLLQNQNGINNNQQKIKELEEKNDELKNIIIKISEEKIKKLEDQIIRMDEKTNAYINEKKKLDEIKNEINENNKKNKEEKLNEIENVINKIRDEIKTIQLSKGGNNNIEESRIKNIEEQIKKLDTNKINENEFQNKILISEEIENKINNNSKTIIQLENKISKLEEEINNLKKIIAEIKAKENNSIKNKSIKDNNEEEKKESLNQIKNEKEKAVGSKNIFGVEIKKENEKVDENEIERKRLEEEYEVDDADIN